MNRVELLQMLDRLSQVYYHQPGEDPLLKMEDLLLEYLKDNPKATEFWIKLALVEFRPPLVDYERIAEYTYQVLSYDPYNIDAILVVAYMQYRFFGNLVSDEIFRKLEMIDSDNCEVKSMISLAKARYCRAISDNEQYEKYLIESIQHCDVHSANFTELGRLYIGMGKISEGKSLLQKGINNIIPDKENHVCDATSLDEFYNEFYKGTSISSLHLDSLKKYYESIS